MSFLFGCSTSLARTGASVDRGRLLASFPLSAKRAAERKFFKLFVSAWEKKKKFVKKIERGQGPSSNLIGRPVVFDRIP